MTSSVKSTREPTHGWPKWLDWLVIALFVAGAVMLTLDVAISGGEVSVAEVVLGLADIPLTIAASVLVVNYLLERETRRERVRRANLPLRHLVEECSFSASRDERLLASIWGDDQIRERLEIPRLAAKLNQDFDLTFVGPPVGDVDSDRLFELVNRLAEAETRLQDEVRMAQQYLEEIKGRSLDRPLRKVGVAVESIREFSTRRDLTGLTPLISRVVAQHWVDTIRFGELCGGLAEPTLSIATALNDPADESSDDNSESQDNLG